MKPDAHNENPGVKTPVSVFFRNFVRQGDEQKVHDIVVSTGFFNELEIPIAVELVEEKLIGGAASSYEFIFAEAENKMVGYSCFGKIAGTESSFDLYWIVVDNEYRGKGIGKQLIEETHRQISDQHGLNIIAETSSTPKYEDTRQFYERMGYRQAGIIHDFYKKGDGKVTYHKILEPCQKSSGSL